MLFKELQNVETPIESNCPSNFLPIGQWHRNGLLRQDNDPLYDQLIVGSGLLTSSFIDWFYGYLAIEIGGWDCSDVKIMSSGISDESRF